MKIRAIDFVLHSVSEIAPAVAFYRGVLGLRLEAYGEAERWAEFDCGNVTLVLQGGVAATAAVSSTKLALAVDDIDQAHAWLTAHGATVLSPPQDYGVCRARSRCAIPTATRSSCTAAPTARVAKRHRRPRRPEFNPGIWPSFPCATSPSNVNSPFCRGPT